MRKRRGKKQGRWDGKVEERKNKGEVKKTMRKREGRDGKERGRTKRMGEDREREKETTVKERRGKEGGEERER